jgi:multicomponent Na+:H+ antiporter subunit D|tara:strand:+ start:798 stop:2537 length:1740 start_codon:yes stop_codon:yes gene_type:complete
MNSAGIAVQFSALPPGVVMILAAIAVPWIPHMARQAWMLAAIALSAWGLTTGAGEHFVWTALGYEFVLYRADALTFPFALIFHIAAALNVFYSAHDRKWTEHMPSLAYAGAAIAAVHAGDLVSLFFWWEATAVTSVFLILSAGTSRAQKAAMRYLLVQVASGVLLLAGAAVLAAEGAGIAFEAFDFNGPGAIGVWLVFLAFGIKAAFPFLNGWLQDAYPEATATGTVALSAFTTKLAIYALARGFPGTDMLIWIGAAMTALPVFFAVIENDLRRVLAFSLNNQLGFMVVAVGIGTPLAINGAVAHAFVHIIYKALLFMSMGAVLYRVGTVKASALGGLYRHMPFTMVCCIIGAMSISAFPLFSGFVAKSLTMSALGYSGIVWVYLVLLFASAGVLEHSGIKIPYFAFFAHGTAYDKKLFADGEAPVGMRIAMGIAALLCIGIGVFPAPLYSILPHAIDYSPYDASHVVGQMQLLVFAMLAFIGLIRFGLYPPEIPSTVLNSDWFYRRLAPRIGRPILAAIASVWTSFVTVLRGYRDALWDLVERVMHAPITGPTVPGRAVMVQTILLTVILAVGYLVAG